MFYNNSKSQEKARYNAMKEVKSGKKVALVARRYGCYRPTIYRWVNKYNKMRKEYDATPDIRHLPTINSKPKLALEVSIESL